MLDEIGFRSLIENKGATYTFAQLLHIDAPSVPLLVHTSNIPTFDDGYFVSCTTLMLYVDDAFTLDKLSGDIYDAWEKGFLNPNTECVGVWKDSRIKTFDAWELSAVRHFTDITEAIEFAVRNEEFSMWDIKNDREIIIKG